MNRPLPKGDEHRRFAKHFEPTGATEIKSDAIKEGRTVFPSTVVDPEESPRLLVSGHNNRKIGKAVTVGRWKGFPIFILTLEERATCPKDCHHWKTCYGNTTHMARRHRHGQALEDRLEVELNELQHQHPEGFVIRLHFLGDFYSPEYVELWRHWLDMFPALHIFGYTAWRPATVIGALVMSLRNQQPERFAMRFSVPVDAYMPYGAAVTVPPGAELPDQPIPGMTVYQSARKPPFLCPAQRRDDKFCGNCAACWESDRTVAFIEHGRKKRGKNRRRKNTRNINVEIGTVVEILGTVMVVERVDKHETVTSDGTAVEIRIAGKPK